MTEWQWQVIMALVRVVYRIINGELENLNTKYSEEESLLREAIQREDTLKAKGNK